MERDWEIILPEINSKFKPTIGKIGHTIESDKPFVVKRIIIEIETDEFEYTDPFYGKINANKTLHEFVNIDLDLLNIEIKSIKELQNKLINQTENQFPGFFSNSLDVVVKELKFGNINTNNTIACSIRYFLTKSDSYPLLSGEKEEHMKFENEINVDLKIKPLLFLDKRKFKIKPLKQFIASDVYQIDSKKELNIVTQEDWYKYTEIELKKNTSA